MIPAFSLRKSSAQIRVLQPVPGLFLFFQIRKVLFPLRGEEILLPGVAFLAGRDHIARDRPASAYDRDEVVHGELISLELLAAIIAGAARAFPLPPLGIPELTGLRFFPFDVLFVRCNKMIGHEKSQREKLRRRKSEPMTVKRIVFLILPS
jgi:hypothetical protein